MQHVIYIVEYCNNLVIRSTWDAVVLQNYDSVCNVILSGARYQALLSGRDSFDAALSALVLGVVDCYEYAILVEGVGKQPSSRR